MTGFLLDNDSVWGRAAGVAVTRDGARLVSDDANGAIFRVTRGSERAVAGPPTGDPFATVSPASVRRCRQRSAQC
jgi:hypothetical protein